MINRNKTDDYYLITVNNNVHQANIRRLETAVKSVNRIAGTRSGGFDGVAVVWNDGIYHNMPARDFMQWAAQQLDARPPTDPHEQNVR